MRSSDRVGVFRGGGARPPYPLIVDYIDQHKHRFGVEPICAALRAEGIAVAPSGCYAHKNRGPSRRALHDAALAETIEAAFFDRDKGRGVYSRLGGIVAWCTCVDRPAPRTENIGVLASHLGLVHHPTVIWAIADRLAQPAERWEPFRAPLPMRMAYVTPSRHRRSWRRPLRSARRCVPHRNNCGGGTVATV